jgi:hypothetical protein
VVEGDEGWTERAGFVCLEGGDWDASGDVGVVDVENESRGGGVVMDDEDDRNKALQRSIKTLGWEKWVDVFVR